MLERIRDYQTNPDCIKVPYDAHMLSCYQLSCKTRLDIWIYRYIDYEYPTFFEILLCGDVLISSDLCDSTKDDFCDEFVRLVFILPSLSLT